MDYVLYSLGTTGDVLPFLSLARELQSRGHQAMFLGNEKFAALSRHFRVDFHAVSTHESYRRTYENPLTWSALHAQNHYSQFHLPALKPTFEWFKHYIHNGKRPFVILQDPLSGAAMACKEFNLPFCRVFLAPSSLHSALNPSFPLRQQVPAEKWSEIIPQLREKSQQDTFNRLVVPFINPARSEQGLPPWKLKDIPSSSDTPFLLSLFPEWLKQAPADWPENLKQTGFLLNDVLPQETDTAITDFIRTHGAPVTFSFGTGIPVTQRLIEKVKRICDQLPAAGILVSSGLRRQLVSGGIKPLLIVPSAKFSEVFPQSRLTVHHGGIGTCAQALAAGIPQLISPYSFDQPDNAFLMWQLGVGNAIQFPSVSVEDIVASISQLTQSQETKQHCMNYCGSTVDSLQESVDFIISSSHQS